MDEWNADIVKAMSHPINRRIVKCLQDADLSFTELLSEVPESNHGKFGYHLRTLRAFVEIEPSTGKYRLTDRGRLLASCIRCISSTTSVDNEYVKCVQDLRVGDHAVVFYTTEDFKHKIVFPYLKAGIQKSEAVVYIVLENRIEKEIREIQRYGVDLNNLKKEAFTIISAYQWYLEEGKAQGETIIANWLTLVKEKEKAGFTGLRVAGEMEVFVDYMETAELMKYEELLGRQLNFNMCGLCLYDRDIFDEDQFTQAYKSHSHLISKGIAGRTPQ